MSTDAQRSEDAASPVNPEPSSASTRGPAPGVALCLSGGGYRAMVFHVGVLWRLNDAGLLKTLDRVSSVSGGSITAGCLGLHWRSLAFDPSTGIAAEFVKHVVTPIRTMASRTIDEWSVISGVLMPGVAISDRVTAAYRKYLFGDATLQHLPDDGEGPRFVINATNVQSGALWRFSKPYMRDYRVGEVASPTIPLATAVAASSAFPPFLSPVRLELEDADFTPGTGQDLQRPPFTTDVVLTDGGVYDNLGLETAFKRYQTILVSDAGGKMAAEEEPKSDWAQHSMRVLDVVDNQVRSLRKRQLMAAYETRPGAYWGIRTDIARYGLSRTLPCPHARTIRLAEIATRLQRLDDTSQERLINWGYAVCDAALRAHYLPTLPSPADFPYPAAGV